MRRSLVCLLLLWGCVTTQPGTTGSSLPVVPLPDGGFAPLPDAGAGAGDGGARLPAVAEKPVDLEALRAEAKALVRKQAEAYWKNWSQGEALDLAATYAGRDAFPRFSK